MQRRTFVRASLSAVVAARAAQAAADEAPLMPDLEIVDPHHHLIKAPATDKAPAREYVLADLAKDIAESGHRVLATVAIEGGTMYRADGLPELKSLGETEFMSAIAAESAKGQHGPARIAAAIVANVDLRLGDRITPVLEAHAAAANGRMRGIRSSSAWDEYPVMGIALDPARKTLLEDPKAREGMKILARQNFVLDTWCFHHQIANVAAAARAVPELTVIMDHIGSPIGGVGPYVGKEKEIFAAWVPAIRAAAQVPNLAVKLGGLGMNFISPQLYKRQPPPTSQELATLWRPYFATCIEAFGANRCMFETNFPPDGGTASYGTLWNTFKRIAAETSDSERTALFSGTAKRVYRLKL